MKIAKKGTCFRSHRFTLWARMGYTSYVPQEVVFEKSNSVICFPIRWMGKAALASFGYFLHLTQIFEEQWPKINFIKTSERFFEILEKIFAKLSGLNTPIPTFLSPHHIYFGVYTFSKKNLFQVLETLVTKNVPFMNYQIWNRNFQLCFRKYSLCTNNFIPTCDDV